MTRALAFTSTVLPRLLGRPAAYMRPVAGTSTVDIAGLDPRPLPQRTTSSARAARAARRATARTIAAYPATRSAAVVALASRTAR